METTTLEAWDIAIIVIYFAIVMAVGIGVSTTYSSRPGEIYREKGTVFLNVHVRSIRKNHHQSQFAMLRVAREMHIHKSPYIHMYVRMFYLGPFSIKGIQYMHFT